MPNLIRIGKNSLGLAPDPELDYLAVVDPVTLEPIDMVTDGSARVLVAARLGAVRLIDNMELGAPG